LFDVAQLDVSLQYAVDMKRLDCTSLPPVSFRRLLLLAMMLVKSMQDNDSLKQAKEVAAWLCRCFEMQPSGLREHIQALPDLHDTVYELFFKLPRLQIDNIGDQELYDFILKNLLDDEETDDVVPFLTAV
jgi:hypothetical protein